MRNIFQVYSMCSMLSLFSLTARAEPLSDEKSSQECESLSDYLSCTSAQACYWTGGECRAYY